ncbi:MAG: WhiB family transcriptional regulator [Dermatophilaceae bacterium]
MAETIMVPPLATEWEWQFEGLCRGLSPEMFFHPEGERGSARRVRDHAAKEVCSRCPVLLQCRAHALANREPYGVWGGMSEDDRLAHYEIAEAS